MRKRLSKRHYKRAPITEAVIDIRVELPPETALQELVAVQEGDEAAYPTKERIRTAHFELSGKSAPVTSHRDIGFLFKSVDGNHVHQARLDGFSLSRMPPYLDWNQFRTEARKRWEIYRAVARPARVVRLAVRYVNRIDIPLPVTDFGEYLQTVPQVSPDLPPDLSAFVMQLMLPLHDVSAFALLNEAIIEPARPGVVSVVLDIDVFRTDDLPNDEEGIWAVLEQFREEKNQVFEASITDKTRELFQ